MIGETVSDVIVWEDLADALFPAAPAAAAVKGGKLDSKRDNINSSSKDAVVGSISAENRFADSSQVDDDETALNDGDDVEDDSLNDSSRGKKGGQVVNPAAGGSSWSQSLSLMSRVVYRLCSPDGLQAVFRTLMRWYDVKVRVVGMQLFSVSYQLLAQLQQLTAVPAI